MTVNHRVTALFLGFWEWTPLGNRARIRRMVFIRRIRMLPIHAPTLRGLRGYALRRLDVWVLRLGLLVQLILLALGCLLVSLIALFRDLGLLRSAWANSQGGQRFLVKLAVSVDPLIHLELPKGLLGALPQDAVYLSDLVTLTLQSLLSITHGFAVCSLLLVHHAGLL